MKRFENVAKLKLARLRVGDIVRTKGYYTPNDGGGAEYLIVASGTGTADGGSYIDIVNAQAELMGELTPKKFGAVLDGVADDSVAITNWLNSGEVLVGEAGEADLPNWSIVNITSNRRIIGNGLKLTGISGEDFVRVNADLDVEGLEFDTWSNVFLKETVDTTDVKVKIKNCKFRNVVLYSVNLSNNVSELIASKNSFYSQGTGSIVIGANTPAAQSSCKNIFIENNLSLDVVNAGAGNAHFLLALCEDIVVKGNIISGVSSNTGEAWGIYTKALQAVISDNIISDVTSTSSNDFGINLKGENRGTGTTAEADRTICHNNVIINSSEGLSGINVNQEKTFVHNNVIEGFLIGVNLSGTHDSNKVENNDIVGVGKASTSCYGIRSTVAGNDLKIGSNSITDVYLGVRVDPAASCNNVKVSKNSIRDFGLAGLFLVPSTGDLKNCKVNDNTVIDGQRFGYFNSIDYLTIKDNHWEGLTDSPFQHIAFDNPSTNTNVSISGNSPLRVTTTTASSTPVVLLNMPDNEACSIKVNALAISSTNRGLFHKQGLIYRAGGTALQQGADENVIADIKSDTTWNISISGNGNASRLDVVGASGQTINWAVDLEYSTVSV